MKKEGNDIIIKFYTENENDYNNSFIEDVYKKIIENRKSILKKLQLKDIRKIIINLYDDRKRFVKEIERDYRESKVPIYCRGTIQNGKIYFLLDTQIERQTYKYEIELRKILHEYIHIIYNEYILNSKNRITWLDEGLAQNLSNEKGRFLKKKFPILDSNINEIDLNSLKHEEGTFMTQNINGYDVSYLTVKYLIDTTSHDEFNKLIRNNEKILELR